MQDMESFQIKKERLNHGKEFEPKKDRETYIYAMKLILKWYIFVRETGIVMQPLLIWFAASSRWIRC